MVKRPAPADDVEQYDDMNDSHSDDGEVVDETTMHNETNLHDGEEILDPDTMINLLDEFDAYALKEGMAEKSRLLTPMVDKFLDACGKKDVVDATHFLKTWKYNTSQAIKSMNIHTTIMVLRHFLESGPAVRNFPGYPKPPPKLFDYFCKKNGINGGFGNRKEALLRLEAEAEAKTQCEKELNVMLDKYIANLHSFIDAHKDKLKADHLHFAQAQLKRNVKKTTPATPRPAKKAKKEEDAPAAPVLQTAYDFFAHSIRDKYTDRPAEEREKKIRKKFEKLDPATKAVFDSLANR